MPPTGSVSEPQLWPEHFDHAVVVTLANELGINVGFSPGDDVVPEPYAYVAPHVQADVDDRYWNVPFGAALRYSELLAEADPDAAVDAFIGEGLRMVLANGL